MNLEIDEYLVEIIQSATEKALLKLFEEHNESFYYCSLITTGEGLCPIISAWSKEALERVANESDDVEEAKYYLKWSYSETPYFAYGEEFFEDVKNVFIDRMNKLKTAEERQREVQLRINSMEKVMHNLDAKGMFGQGEQRLNIVINAEFMPPDYTNTERALRLNPQEALKEWLEEAAE
ncbi:DUF4303 domain-containing protein [Butyrivibrio sp. XB500-5]|uniref:DUF4303 domain-containing protein n=1 Tax=Butyrivibrio sp. XB500-5 TaxID=2364880 RepID=UPI000EA96C5E|nr:DUF4303 domain-containing protein [Butyrivibrio sp. XB500-5]RKM63056.1 DUF4303 domain-containing protein [Butyrivibrio sp. XB500-5]